MGGAIGYPIGAPIGGPRGVGYPNWFIGGIMLFYPGNPDVGPTGIEGGIYMLLTFKGG